MSITAGFTSAEIRAFVLEYEGRPQGTKALWLQEQGVSYSVLRRWRSAVFDGDVERGLIPREGGGVSVPQRRRAELGLRRANDRAEAEIERLTARVRELEQANEALGKAIGLLHKVSEQEPVDDPTTSGPSSSSTPRPTSSHD